MPRIARPPLRWSRVVASFAVRPGLRNVLAATRRPIRAPGGHGGDRGERRPAFELGVAPVALVGQQVVVEPEVVEPGGLGPDGGVAKIRPSRSLDPERRAEAHRHRSPPRPYRTDVAAQTRTVPRLAPAVDPAVVDPSRAPRRHPRLVRRERPPARVPGDPRPVRGARVGADGAADPGRARGDGVDRVDGALPDGGVAGGGACRRGRACLGRARLQPSGDQPAACGAGHRRRARRPRARHRRGARRVARGRAVYRPGRRRDRLRTTGRGRRHERQARAGTRRRG